MEQVDALVVGSGQGGVPLAVSLAAQGKRVVLFERERFGGSCVNWGCTPSKAFLAAAHAAGNAREAATLGVHCQVDADFSQIMARVRAIRDHFAQGTRERLERAGVQLIHAQASLTADGCARAEEQTFCAPLTILDTGSSPASPPIQGLEEIPYLTDRNFWSLTHCPQRTLIIGGGYIGLELGQGLARLGSEVHILQRGEKVLARESAEVSSVLSEALQRDGVAIHRRANVVRASASNSLYRLHLDSGETLEGDAVVVAVGRQPNTRALAAETAGVALDERGYVRVNEQLETTRPGVYAIGEVAGQPAFTHVSWEDHRRILAVLDGKPRSRDDRVLAYAVFTRPQVGRAGLSLEQAKAEGLSVHAARLEIKNTNRAIEWGQDLGFFELIVEEPSERIVGATIVAPEAAELIHVFLDLIEAGASAGFLDAMQHIHPTYAEYFPSLARKAWHAT